MIYADIIIDISHEKVDRTFSYAVPGELEGRVSVGSAVVIPFGRGDTRRTGYVVGLSTEPPEGIEADRIKPITGLVAGALPIESQLIALAAWMRSHYGSTMTRALRTVIPVKKKEQPKERKLVEVVVSADRLNDERAELISRKRHSVAKERLYDALIEDYGRQLPWELLTGKLQITSQAIRDMEKDGIIRIESERSYRNPLDSVLEAVGDTQKYGSGLNEQNSGEQLTDGRQQDIDKDENTSGQVGQIVLNPEQQKALRVFRETRADRHHNGHETLNDDASSENTDITIDAPPTFLLYGITGSGKTEVYIEMIKDVISEGKQAIVLIPEIALTYQTVMRFYRNFGDRVSFLNSRMSPGERYDQYERAKNGQIDIMVGPRSALFTAFSNLGLIIIDEEHETSYQSEQPPRYHARETAEERARLAGATLVLGSATPSLEAYSRAIEGRYTLLRLTERAVSGAVLPQTHIIDLRAELKSGNRSILSRKLQSAISDRLSRGEQCMLFLNRRGVSGFVSCRSCGEVIKCPHCDVSLSEHRDGKLHCHYCGYQTIKPATCPSCGSKYMAGFKVGTEKVEEEVKKLYPKARILRMDADTTTGKEGHTKILSAFSDHEADILIGTQMIVKGHDFANVTLMGILAADQALNDHDFRSAERCYDLIVQAAGRAGRGSRQGEVIIQTYKPEHYAITTSAAGDYEGFYRQEIAYRDLMGYPPHSHMLTFLITSPYDGDADRAAGVIAEHIKQVDPKVFLAGPHSAGIAKIKDIYRRMVYLKDDDYEHLVSIKDAVEKLTNGNPVFTRVQVFTSFD